MKISAEVTQGVDSFAVVAEVAATAPELTALLGPKLPAGVVIGAADGHFEVRYPSPLGVLDVRAKVTVEPG